MQNEGIPPWLNQPAPSSPAPPEGGHGAPAPPAAPNQDRPVQTRFPPGPGQQPGQPSVGPPGPQPTNVPTATSSSPQSQPPGQPAPGRILLPRVSPQFRNRPRRPPEVVSRGRIKQKDYPFWFDLLGYIEEELASKVQRGELPRKGLYAPTEGRAQIERLIAPYVGPGIARALSPYLHEELFGLGRLSPLLLREDIEDVLINSAHDVVVVVRGRSARLPSTPWQDDEELKEWLITVANGFGKVLSDDHPYVEAADQTGVRATLILPPVSDRPAAAFRVHKKSRFAPEQYRASGVAPEETLDRLINYVRERKNILIAGEVGCGKTTLLNFLAQHFAPEERVLVVEDTRELAFSHPNALFLSTFAPTLKHEEVSLRDLAVAALRLLPDRILVGEVRGAEALVLLRAMSVGHKGTMCTIHANSGPDALRQIAKYTLMDADNNIPEWLLYEMIGASIDVVVYMTRSNVKKRIAHIVEVAHPRTLHADAAADGWQELERGRIVFRMVYAAPDLPPPIVAGARPYQPNDATEPSAATLAQTMQSILRAVEKEAPRGGSTTDHQAENDLLAAADTMGTEHQQPLPNQNKTQNVAKNVGQDNRSEDKGSAPSKIATETLEQLGQEPVSEESVTGSTATDTGKKAPPLVDKPSISFGDNINTSSGNEQAATRGPHHEQQQSPPAETELNKESSGEPSMIGSPESREHTATNTEAPPGANQTEPPLDESLLAIEDPWGAPPAPTETQQQATPLPPKPAWWSNLAE